MKLLGATCDWASFSSRVGEREGVPILLVDLWYRNHDKVWLYVRNLACRILAIREEDLSPWHLQIKNKIRALDHFTMRPTLHTFPSSSSVHIKVKIQGECNLIISH